MLKLEPRHKITHSDQDFCWQVTAHGRGNTYARQFYDNWDHACADMAHAQFDYPGCRCEIRRVIRTSQQVTPAWPESNVKAKLAIKAVKEDHNEDYQYDMKNVR